MDSASSSSTNPNMEKREKFSYDTTTHNLRKRLPRKMPRNKNDVYVTRKTNFKVQLERCKKLLDEGEDMVFIHGLGAAINRAITLSLKLKTIYGNTLEVEANTSTVEVVDDYEPENEDLKTISQNRNTSAIHIRVFKTVIMPPVTIT